MLHAISWGEYLKLVLVCLATYYVFILLRFFPKALSRLRHGYKESKRVSGAVDNDSEEEVETTNEGISELGNGSREE